MIKKIRTILLALTILLFQGYYALCQINIAGEYILIPKTYESLKLFNDSVYEHKFYTGYMYSEYTGKYSVIGDTIFLNYKGELCKKFLIISEQNSEKYGLWRISPVTIAKIIPSWSKDELYGSVNKDEALTFQYYARKSEFYPTGSLKFNANYFDLDRFNYMITHYYESGQVKRVEFYKNYKKHNKWLYYLPNGDLEKIEHYKRDKLKKTVKPLVTIVK